ncbi:hypothetical protein RHVP.55 [Cricetid gammaherpesvirus 2]|uniref:Tegument protein UL51 homolog n=1 Tax=Cricetid gammaherpesvirus 2 TaxID=1605972 RepID=E9M5N8_9GAMA|nr:hypothetical protein RHVP.55 [Cricetid gammaherpesvirus 2]ADW24396.1 hypothetical protein RHVP.55 [Cricetid gammaherpesvirus 2]ADW24478.1 hypothetical protein RHVP-L.55 [Cricetid gammaherpesvirus 2]
MAGKMNCCGIWPFGKGKRSGYARVSDTELMSRVEIEVNMGLPPGVTMGDVLRNDQNGAVMKQIYVLANQANEVAEYLNRFTLAEIPEECMSVAKTQIDKLKSLQKVIWNTMISMAAGTITINEDTLNTLLDRRAEDSLVLMEMEKLATLVKMDETATWAADIANIVSTQPSSVATQKIPQCLEPRVEICE